MIAVVNLSSQRRILQIFTFKGKISLLWGLKGVKTKEGFASYSSWKFKFAAEFIIFHSCRQRKKNVLTAFLYILYFARFFLVIQEKRKIGIIVSSSSPSAFYYAWKNKEETWIMISCEQWPRARSIERWLQLLLSCQKNILKSHASGSKGWNLSKIFFLIQTRACIIATFCV